VTQTRQTTYNGSLLFTPMSCVSIGDLGSQVYVEGLISNFTKAGTDCQSYNFETLQATTRLESQLLFLLLLFCDV